MQPYKAHPWHGISAGPHAPEYLSTFVEIVPSDTVKYEIDKASGYLRIDRPQKFSNVPPALYGFVPRTYCREQVAALCMTATGRTGIIGDGDPLDVLVLTEHHIPHGDILVRCKPIGGLLMIDNNEADDKIIAVLMGDAMYENYNDLSELPEGIVNRLKHYFLTYKQMPDGTPRTVVISQEYGREMAHKVILASMHDYKKHFT